MHLQSSRRQLPSIQTQCTNKIQYASTCNWIICCQNGHWFLICQQKVCTFFKLQHMYGMPVFGLSLRCALAIDQSSKAGRSSFKCEGRSISNCNFHAQFIISSAICTSCCIKHCVEANVTYKSVPNHQKLFHLLAVYIGKVGFHCTHVWVR